MDWDLKYKKILIGLLIDALVFLIVGILGCCFFIVFGKHELKLYLMYIEILVGISIGIVVFISLIVISIEDDPFTLLGIDPKNVEAQIKYLQFKKELVDLKKNE